MPVWTKPEVTDVTIECDEDILANCWSASATTPFICQCGPAGLCPNS